MGHPNVIKGEIVKEYLDRLMTESQGDIKIYKRTLALKIFNENPGVFKDVEEVRSKIRYYTGSYGKRERERNTIKKYLDIFPNPYGFPKPEQDMEFSAEPYELPSYCQSVGIIGDLHIPYHDIPSITASFNWMKEHKVDSILINGDLIDCYQLSNFEKDPRCRDMAGEIKNVIEFFDILRSNFPDARIFYRKANHEYRWERYMMLKAYELLNIPDFKFDNVLKLKYFDITPIPHKTRIKIGECFVLHGDEYNARMSPDLAHPARWLYLKTKCNAIAGHFHRVSEYVEPNLQDKTSATWTIGCLCNLHPFWLPYNKWGHGFARIRLHKDGRFDVTNLKIIEGKVY